MVPRKLEPADVVEWYDGVVLAVVRPSWRDGSFLASLLGWLQSDRRRVYALVPLGAEDVADIARLGKSNWDDLVSGIRKYLDGAAGDIPVVTVDEVTGEVVREDVFDVKRIRGHLVGDIEAALSDPFVPWNCVRE